MCELCATSRKYAVRIGSSVWLMSRFTSPKRWTTLGRLLVVDVQHERERQHRLVAVGGDQLDARQVLVVLVRLGLAGDPAQHEVHGRHELDLQRVRIERVLAGRQRLLPDAALAGLDLLAVAEARRR